MWVNRNSVIWLPRLYPWELLLRNKHLLAVGVLSVLLCLSLVVSVEADAAMWARTYGGPGHDRAFSLIATSDGGYALAGTTESPVAGDLDFWLVKTDSVGNLEWNRTYGGTEDDVARSLVATPDGGYAVAGVWNTSTDYWLDHYFGGDIWLVKTDKLGNLQWNKTYGGADFAVARSLIVTSDGGYALAGSTGELLSGVRDFWLFKTDAAGNAEWNQTYGRGSWNEAFYSLVATSDGGYALAGVRRDDFWLVKTDSVGNAEWNRTYGGADAEEAYSLIPTSDGGYALAGFKGIPHLSADFWLVKTDSYGNEQWNRTYGGAGEDFAYSLVATSDGGYALAGYWNYYYTLGILDMGLPLHGDCYLVKTDQLGNMEWNRTYGGATVLDGAYSLLETPDRGFALAGYCDYSIGFKIEGSVRTGDIWLIKTDELGVVPELPAWMMLPSLMILTLTASMLFRRRERT